MVSPLPTFLVDLRAYIGWTGAETLPWLPDYWCDFFQLERASLGSVLLLHRECAWVAAYTFGLRRAFQRHRIRICKDVWLGRRLFGRVPI